MPLPHWTRILWRTSLALLTAVLSGTTVRADEVSFRNEVMAVLSRAGCNQGTCHGNLNGKNGFKLSLRGQDADFDLAALARGSLGRRTNPHQPEASLLLLKATATVPHEGGQRFTVHSPEYAILKAWIAAGLRPDPAHTKTLKRLEVTPPAAVLIAPANQLTVKAKAIFSDGSVRDVTGLAVFETSNPAVEVNGAGVVRTEQPAQTNVVVRYLEQQVSIQLAFVPARPDFVWSKPPQANYIDRHVFARLKQLRMNPSELAADSIFLRRAYLDGIGVLPTPAETRNFLADQRPDKRARLIDVLLERPEFADLWALRWSDLLRNEEKVLDRKGVQFFYQWIRNSIATNKPLNEFARELIASRGSTYSEPAANYYRALRDPQARSEATAQVFLGIRMQCAKCHNHPFNLWTQTDYHRLAAFFPRVQYRIVGNNRKDKLDKHEFDGEQVVFMAREGEVKHPVSGEVLLPRFLGADLIGLTETNDRLLLLADWVAAPGNPFFARTQANRIWNNLLGRGIVDPNDDFRLSNPPVNGPLLEALARDFVNHKFDLKYLVRTIMNSRTYQLSAVPNDTNRDDDINFSHAAVRSLSAEQLLDAIAQVTAMPAQFEGYALGLRAGQLPGLRIVRKGDPRAVDSEKFLRQFGKPERLLNCDCERSDDPTLGQALQLLTGPLVNRAVSADNNRLGKLLAAAKSNAVIVEELFLAAYSRLPTLAERTGLVDRLERADDRRTALEDLLWALVNSKEFLVRQ